MRNITHNRAFPYEKMTNLTSWSAPSHEHGPRDEDHTTIGFAENDGSDVLSFNIQGGDGNDEIFGGSNDDTIKGGNGFDRLYGENGDDRIYGGADTDWLFGGVTKTSSSVRTVVTSCMAERVMISLMAVN